jgi:hypothetical protein
MLERGLTVAGHVICPGHGAPWRNNGLLNSLLVDLAEWRNKTEDFVNDTFQTQTKPCVHVLHGAKLEAVSASSHGCKQHQAALGQ